MGSMWGEICFGDAGDTENVRASEEMQQIITSTQGQPGALIRVLQKAQELFGYLPKPVLEIISRRMKVPLSEVYGIVTFYHFFSTVPKGKYVIQVCMGTSCYVRGGGKLLDVLRKNWGLEPGGITDDRVFSLETVRCLGACGLSPVMAISGDVHGRVKASRVKEILDSYRMEENSQK